MGISRSTLYRRLHDAGISTDDYSNISSAELDEVIKEIKSQFPNDGEVMLKGHLLRLGLKVTRQDLRDSIHRVDHANTVARRSTVVQRRLYAVACPNAVWHMDSHHKLIRWRFITHAAIDGFSRTMLYVLITTKLTQCSLVFRMVYLSMDCLNVSAQITVVKTLKYGNI